MFLRRLFLLHLVCQQKLDTVVLIEHFRDRDLEENLEVVDNVVKHDRFVRRNADIDDIVAYICNLQIFDPCCIGYI